MLASEVSGWAPKILNEQPPTDCIFGIEFLPVPCFAGHGQVGPTIPEFGAALAATGADLVGVLPASRAYGMGARVEQATALTVLVEERKRAERVKLAMPVLGVPQSVTYSGFSGMVAAEECAPFRPRQVCSRQ